MLDLRQFPRTDSDYLAQIKKMSADLGLDVAALSDDAFFAHDAREMEATLRIAGAIGAPLLAGRLALETAVAWSRQLAHINDATGLAKAANITLAVRNAPQTFAATSHDCKRVSKEADSAWLRFGVEPGAFDGASDVAAIAEKAVLLWREVDEEPTFAGWEHFRGYVALDAHAGTASLDEMQSAMRRWRIAQAESVLNRT